MEETLIREYEDEIHKLTFLTVKFTFFLDASTGRKL
jgi:hypothetical protein